MTDERFEYAVGLMDSGQLEGALQELRALHDSTTDPVDKASLLVNEVACLGRLGRTKQARERLREAARLLSKNSPFWLDIDLQDAILCMDERKFKKALRKLDQLLKRNSELLHTPDFEDAYQTIQIKRGILLAEFNRPREARPVLEETLSFELRKPEKGEVRFHLGICYFNLKEMKQAREMLVEALETGVDKYRTTQAHYYLGLLYLAEGAFAKARQELELCEPGASEADIPKKYVYQNIATACQQLGLEDEAERYTRLAKKG